MRLTSITALLLASTAIFGLSLAKPWSAQAGKVKRSGDCVAAPKVFIIDMVGLPGLSLQATLLRGCYSFLLKGRSGTAFQSSIYWNKTSQFLVFPRCSRTSIVPAMARYARSLPGRAVCTPIQDCILPFHDRSRLTNPEINAASTISALTFSRLFDFTSTYFLIAGIAGVNPEVATLGSVTFARYAVQGKSPSQPPTRPPSPPPS